MTGFMFLQYTFNDNAYAELASPDIKFWAGTGLPDYEGGIDGFKEVFPMHFEELLVNGLIKQQG